MSRYSSAELKPHELLREDGLRIERLCKHGVGHPVRMTRPLTPAEEDWVWVHGCDGCCGQREFHRHAPDCASQGTVGGQGLEFIPCDCGAE